MSAFLGYINDWPLSYIFLAALFAFAMVALALNNLSQWMAAQTPADKVDFAGPIIGVTDPSTPSAGKGIKLGITVRSRAPFPVEVRVDDLETQVSNRVPSEAFASRSLIVGQGAVAQFSNALIKLDGVERANQVIPGQLKATISYGRPGRLKYTAETRHFFALKFDENENFAHAEISQTEMTIESPPQPDSESPKTNKRIGRKA